MNVLPRLVLAIALAAPAVAQPPNKPDRPAEWEALARRVHGIADPSDDAWPIMTDLFARFDQACDEAAAALQIDRDALIDSIGKATKPDAAAVDIAAARRVIESAQKAGVFERVDALETKRGFVRPVNANRMVDTELRDLAPARHLFRVQVVRLRDAAEAGRWDEAASAIAQSLTLGRLYVGGGTAIEYLVGCAFVTLAQQEASQRLPGRAPAEALHRIAGAVDWLPDFGIANVLAGQRIIGSDFIERTIPEEGAGPMKSRAKQLATLNQAHARMSEVQMLGPRDWQEPASALQAEIDVQSQNYDCPAIIFPDLARLLKARDQTTLHRDGFRILLAIELHRAQTGSEPESLDALIPGLLKSLPRDPFADDARFRYRRTDPATDPLHRRYILYSVGFDGADNNASQDPAGNYRALDPTGAGHDFLINPEPDPK